MGPMVGADARRTSATMLAAAARVRGWSVTLCPTTRSKGVDLSPVMPFEASRREASRSIPLAGEMLGDGIHLPRGQLPDWVGAAVAQAWRSPAESTNGVGWASQHGGGLVQLPHSLSHSNNQQRLCAHPSGVLKPQRRETTCPHPHPRQPRQRHRAPVTTLTIPPPQQRQGIRFSIKRQPGQGRVEWCTQTSPSTSRPWATMDSPSSSHHSLLSMHGWLWEAGQAGQVYIKHLQPSHPHEQTITAPCGTAQSHMLMHSKQNPTKGLLHKHHGCLHKRRAWSAG